MSFITEIAQEYLIDDHSVQNILLFKIKKDVSPLTNGPLAIKKSLSFLNR